MKILIADDQPSRYEKLIKDLIEIGITKDQIKIVICANDAREELEKNSYTILVLDILLPLNMENKVEGSRHSMDLLSTLKQEDDLIKPSYIIGITADKSLVINVESDFSNSMWKLIEYNESRDDWKEQIKNCVEYVLIKEKNTMPENIDYGVDLAIVCALERPELEAVLKLNWNWSPSRPLNDLIFVYDGWFEKNGRKITVVAAYAQRMGMVETAILSSHIISLLHPRLIAMCGICAGVKGKVNLGDIIFAETAWDYQSGKLEKKDDASRLSIEPNQLHADTIIRNHIKDIDSNNRDKIDKILLEYEGSEKSAYTIPRLFVAPVASGAAVLSDDGTIQQIKEQHRKLLGVEMEIYGLYAAVAMAAPLKPKVFALKSVCDFGDSDKADHAQKYAAYTSARALQLLMETHGDRLLS